MTASPLLPVTTAIAFVGAGVGLTLCVSDAAGNFRRWDYPNGLHSVLAALQLERSSS